MFHSSNLTLQGNLTITMTKLKISLLLPSRNRPEYLQYAIESIRLQDYADWEIIVADNCSDIPIANDRSLLNDARIKIKRANYPLSVTDNWNIALAASSGEYILMLGDDDAIMPKYLSEMTGLLEKFNSPDVVYTGAELFTYPQVDPNYPTGYLMPYSYATFFRGKRDPFLLNKETALNAVRSAMSFEVTYGFNMQFALISRKLITRLTRFGPFFQSDFPDYYAMNTVFLTADRILVNPSPQVIIGVTPKSYGYFHINRHEIEARELLSTKSVNTLVGSHINQGWLSAMSVLEANFGRDFNLRVDHKRYKWLEARAIYEKFRLYELNRKTAWQFFLELPRPERYLFQFATLIRIDPHKVRRFLSLLRVNPRKQLPTWDPPKVVGKYNTIRDVFYAYLDKPDLLS